MVKELYQSWHVPEIFLHIYSQATNTRIDEIACDSPILSGNTKLIPCEAKVVTSRISYVHCLTYSPTFSLCTFLGPRDQKVEVEMYPNYSHSKWPAYRIHSNNPATQAVNASSRENINVTVELKAAVFLGSHSAPHTSRS